MWSLHGSIFYLAIRKWVYGSPVPADLEPAILRLIDEHYDTAQHVVRRASGVCGSFEQGARPAYGLALLRPLLESL